FSSLPKARRRWERSSASSPAVRQSATKTDRRTWRRKDGNIHCENRSEHRTSNIEHRMVNEQRVSHSVADTERIAAELARTLRGGEVIALHGELGAGKTQFTRGIVRALGGDAHAVNSPTFVLLNVYDTPSLRVFHLDAYRVH